MPLLTDADKQKVRDAIEKVEQRTRCEFITVLAPASDDYYFIPTLWAAILALLVPAVIMLSGFWMNSHEIYTAQLISFFVMLAVFQFTPIKMKLVPASVRRMRASRLAREQFFLQGLHHTAEKTGVLLFVSAAEHYVELIADQGINAKVENSAWNQVIEDFVSRVKQRQYVEGFVAAIESCGEVMAQHFPADGENPNELPDRFIEL